MTHDDDEFDADQLKSGMWRVTHRDTKIAGIGSTMELARDHCREHMRLARVGAYLKHGVPQSVTGPSDATPVDPCAETVTNGKLDDGDDASD